MSNLEKFGLFSGIMGVIVDATTIIGYLSGLINFGSQDNTINKNQAPTLIIIIMAIIIIYSWLVIAWVLTKRRVTNLKSKSIKFDFDEVIRRSVTGVGLVMLPLIFGWFVVNRFSTIGTPTTEIRNMAVVFATQTAQVFDNPIYATKVAATEMAGGNIVIPESVDAIEYELHHNGDFPRGFGTYVFLFPISSIALGSVVFGIINLLMPIIYDDIFDDDKALGIVKK